MTVIGPEFVVNCDKVGKKPDSPEIVALRSQVAKLGYSLSCSASQSETATLRVDISGDEQVKKAKAALNAASGSYPKRVEAEYALGVAEGAVTEPHNKALIGSDVLATINALEKAAITSNRSVQVSASIRVVDKSKGTGR